MSRPGSLSGDVIQLLRRATLIADAAAFSDIEANADAVSTGEGPQWYDVRPMLDEREHSLEAIDLATEAIHYAVQRGLATRHPTIPHLLRLNPAALRRTQEITHGG